MVLSPLGAAPDIVGSDLAQVAELTIERDLNSPSSPFSGVCRTTKTLRIRCRSRLRYFNGAGRCHLRSRWSTSREWRGWLTPGSRGAAHSKDNTPAHVPRRAYRSRARRAAALLRRGISVRRRRVGDPAGRGPPNGVGSPNVSWCLSSAAGARLGAEAGTGDADVALEPGGLTRLDYVEGTHEPSAASVALTPPALRTSATNRRFGPLTQWGAAGAVSCATLPALARAWHGRR
jgi:hypothetical protein